MLLSAVITLEPLDEAARHARTRQVLAWFKSRFEECNPTLFAEVHQDNAPRPYTLSGVNPARGGYPAWLRITSLDADLSELLSERLLPRADDQIMLDPRGQQTRFAVRSVFTGSERAVPIEGIRHGVEDPEAWAGHTRYSDLIDAAFDMPKDPAAEIAIKLHFGSCTTFRVNTSGTFTNNLPLPMPRFVFQSCVRQWDALAPAPLPMTLLPFLEHYVRVSYHRIQLANEVFGGGSQGKVVGFTGDVEFELSSERGLPPELQTAWRAYVDHVVLLAGFAFYAGMGWRTTHGLGQTLPLVVAEK